MAQERDGGVTGLVPGNDVRMRLLHALGGGYSPIVRHYRRWRPRWLWRITSPLGRVTTRYVAENGLEVRRGPFAGMRYPAPATGRAGALAAKLLGAFEPEVATVLERADGFDALVDVGAGEGYYCVGMALRSPRMKVVGYETDGAERRLSRRLAELNGVRFDARGTCTVEDLRRLPGSRVLLIVDVEGFEDELLDVDAAPALRSATLIVETHSSATLESLTRRLEPTHVVELVQQAAKRPADYPELTAWSPADAQLALSEGRSHPGVWMHCVPR